MSLIFGIFNFDKNQNVTESCMDEIYEGIKHFPHENKTTVCYLNCGFGHLQTFNTPESLFEKLPIFKRTEQLLFVSQGRIDNRKELAFELNLRYSDKLTDCDLMLTSYMKWGQNCPKKLLGDWSFVVLDLKEQRLFAARDQHGYTALYYFLDQNRFVFSSSIKVILHLKNFQKKVNEERFLRAMLIWPSDNKYDGEQLYKDIYNLLPGHLLTLENRNININRYWNPEHINPFKRAKVKDYAEEVLEILNLSISDRLRSYKPVASMLSGGLDSSTVSYLAAEQLKIQNIKLKTFSHVPLFKSELENRKFEGRFLDESFNILSIAKLSKNIDAELIDSVNISPLEGLELAIETFERNIHGACNTFWMMDIAKKASENGFGALLSGENGNAGISFTGSEQFLSIIHPFFVNHPKKFLLNAILKPIFNRFFQPFSSFRTNPLLKYVSTSYINPETLKAWDITNDIVINSKNFNNKFFNVNDHKLGILMPGYNSRCQFGADESHAFGFEKRDPTSDIRILEFCLGIPNEAFFDKHYNKAILRKMMKNKLPDQVLYEKRMGMQSADLNYRLKKNYLEIDTFLSNIKNNDRINTYFDMKKIECDWINLKSKNSYDIYKAHNFLKTIMGLYFLYKKFPN